MKQMSKPNKKTETTRPEAGNGNKREKRVTTEQSTKASLLKAENDAARRYGRNQKRQAPQKDKAAPSSQTTRSAGENAKSSVAGMQKGKEKERGNGHTSSDASQQGAVAVEKEVKQERGRTFDQTPSSPNASVIYGNPEFAGTAPSPRRPVAIARRPMTKVHDKSKSKSKEAAKAALAAKAFAMPSMRDGQENGSLGEEVRSSQSISGERLEKVTENLPPDAPISSNTAIVQRETETRNEQMQFEDLSTGNLFPEVSGAIPSSQTNLLTEMESGITTDKQPNSTPTTRNDSESRVSKNADKKHITENPAEEVDRVIAGLLDTLEFTETALNKTSSVETSTTPADENQAVAGVTQNEEMEVDDLQRQGKRQLSERPDCSQKRTRTDKDQSGEEFSVFLNSSTKPTAEKLKATLIDIGLLKIEEKKLISHICCLSHCHDQRLWHFNFQARGELNNKINALLRRSDRIAELLRVNTDAYGKETSKHVLISEGMNKSEIAKTFFLLSIQKIIGFDVASVDSGSLVIQYGKRLSIAEVFRTFPEPATKAYMLSDAYTKGQLSNEMGPEHFSTFQSSLDADTFKKLNDALEKLNEPEASECNSILKRCLTRNTIEKYKDRRTKDGLTLNDCIMSGVLNPDSRVGVFAASSDAYSCFPEFFNRVIEELHGFNSTARQPPINLGNGSEFPPLDPEGNYIKSTRIRCTRSLKGFPFHPLMTKNQYLCMEGRLKQGFLNYTEDDMKGAYYSLAGEMPPNKKNVLTQEFLHKDRFRYLKHANGTKHWPSGRGVYQNEAKTLTVFVNLEEHLKFVSQDKGSDIGKVVDLLNRGLNGLGGQISYLRARRLGWLAFNPSHLGNSIHASVRIQLPKLSARPDFLDISKLLHLKVEGEVSTDHGPIYTISNETAMGISESDAIKQLYAGVKQLIRMEEKIGADTE